MSFIKTIVVNKTKMYVCDNSKNAGDLILSNDIRDSKKYVKEPKEEEGFNVEDMKA